MKHIAFLTAIAMAVPVAAFADPPHVEVRGRADIVFSHDRYDRYEGSRFSREFRGRWTPLARGYNAASEKQTITAGNRTYRKIRIEGTRGEPVVLKVAIEFADRSMQAVELDSRLGNGAGEVIDLNGGDRKINRIIVYTSPRSRGSYSVYGA